MMRASRGAPKAPPPTSGTVAITFVPSNQPDRSSPRLASPVVQKGPQSRCLLLQGLLAGGLARIRAAASVTGHPRKFLSPVPSDPR